MIIVGTTGITFTKEEYSFFCPDCGETSVGHRKEVRQFLTLYFIPLIPLSVSRQFIECDQCRAAFEMDVLNYRPEEDWGRFIMDLVNVMILTMIADGTVDDQEVETIQRIYRDLTGDDLAREQLDERVALAGQSDIEAVVYVGQMASALDEQKRAVVIKCAFLVASATGELQDAQSEQLQLIGDALNISDDKYRQYIEEAMAGQ